jgi:hypothetical protein
LSNANDTLLALICLPTFIMLQSTRSKCEGTFGTKPTLWPYARSGLGPHFQEYDPHTVDLDQDTDLVIQRTLAYGTWNEVRWLFDTYGGPRIRAFVRERGERLLSPVTFNYWRKLLGIRQWRRSPFPTARGEAWNR